VADPPHVDLEEAASFITLDDAQLLVAELERADEESRASFADALRRPA
jgi:hypothetical protein